MTFPDPTWSLMISMASETKLPGVHSGRHPQVLYRKFSSRVRPWGVCATSGWNWIPNMPRWLPMTAMGELLVYASAENPSGGSTIWSPWLIHTGIDWGRPWNRGSSRGVLVQDGVSVLAGDRWGHLAAQLVDHRLHAVADAQNGETAVVDPGRGQGRSRRVNAGGTAGENDALRAQGRDVFPGSVVRNNFAVNFAFPDSPRDEPAVLGAKVDDDNGLTVYFWGCFGARLLAALLSGDLQIRRDLQIVAGCHSAAGSGIGLVRHPSRRN